MTLEPNTRLGPYEILSPLGAGGMGEVYRARDERLGRDVAIKILPIAHTESDDRLSRFEQEARATGALNHPNVVAVYDVGRYDGAPYVVTELLAGETLRDKLRAGALAPRRAIDFAVQIARGLAAAHEKGIIHRDIKPENLFVTTDGRVKILDFGLAKVTAEVPLGADSAVATLRAPTNPGVVMGTVGYMSPEQVRGLGVDHRTDIFSLGAVLYEMLTGQRAFRGDSAIEIMNSILKEEPPEITSLVGALPIGLDRVVRHCLEKAVDARFQSASDLAFDLEAQSLYSGPLSSAASQARPVNWRRLWPIAAAAALVAAAVLGVALGRTWFAGAEPPTPAYSQLTFRKGAVHSARFAPDGQTVVYSAAWDGKESNLFLVRPGNPETRSLDMPETHVLAISKSGEMAVVREGTLSRVALTGGSPRAVLENVEGADWSPTGRDELAVVHWANGKFRLEYPIGTVRYESDTVLMSPRFSPDGKHIAFFNHPIKGDDRGRVMVATVDGPTRVVSEGWSSLGGLAWSPTGNEIWFAGARTGANRSIHAATIDGESRLISSVAGSLYLLDVTPDGRALVARESHRMEIMARTRGEAAERELAWLDGSLATDISGDGTTMLFSELNHGGGTNYSVYLRKTDGSPAVRLGDGNGTSLSPDGRFALSILPTTPPQIVMLPTGPGESRVLVSGGLDQIATARWFPDGRRVVVVGQEAGKAWRSYVVDVATGSLAPLTPENIKGALVTPDGTRLAAHDGTANRWVLYSLESGTIAPIAGLGEDEGPIQWSDDGRTIFIRETKQFPTRIFRLNPASGTREQVAELRPPDLTGVKPYPRSIVVTDDGKTYAYTYMRAASELYMLEGCTEWCREGLDSSFLSAMGGPA